MSKRIILIQSNCGKYDLFIRDMPLGLLYVSRLLVDEGYDVCIVDQRVEGNSFFDKLEQMLSEDVLWIGVTAMTGEPVHHSLDICKFLRTRTTAPLVWGGIHPTILSDSTLEHELVDYVIRGKGERSVLMLSQALQGELEFSQVRGFGMGAASRCTLQFS